MKLLEQPHRLRVGGTPPNSSTTFELVLARSGEMHSITLGSDAETGLYTWSRAVDPGLSEFGQLRGLLHRAVIDLEETLEAFGLAISQITATTASMKRPATSHDLYSVLCGRREDACRTPIDLDGDQVLVELESVTCIKITLERRVQPLPNFEEPEGDLLGL